MASSRKVATPKARSDAAIAQAAHGAPVGVHGRAAVPTPPAPPRAGGAAPVPRTTLDNPWRDLHPARVWPD